MLKYFFFAILSLFRLGYTEKCYEIGATSFTSTSNAVPISECEGFVDFQSVDDNLDTNSYGLTDLVSGRTDLIHIYVEENKTGYTYTGYNEWHGFSSGKQVYFSIYIHLLYHTLAICIYSIYII